MHILRFAVAISLPFDAKTVAAFADFLAAGVTFS